MPASDMALGHPRAPSNADQLTNLAQDYEFDASVPLKYWLRTASALSKQVSTRIKHHHEQYLTSRAGR